MGSFKSELEFQIRANLGAWAAGRTVWWYEHRIRPGDSIRRTIKDALNRSAVVVSLCVSELPWLRLLHGGTRRVRKRRARDGGIQVENIACSTQS